MLTVRHFREDRATAGSKDTYYQCERAAVVLDEAVAGQQRGALILSAVTGLPLHVLWGGRAYIMNERGKTVGTHVLPEEPTQAQRDLVRAIVARGMAEVREQAQEHLNRRYARAMQPIDPVAFQENADAGFAVMNRTAPPEFDPSLKVSGLPPMMGPGRFYVRDRRVAATWAVSGVVFGQAAPDLEDGVYTMAHGGEPQLVAAVSK